MGTLFTISYSIVLLGAGIYAILLAHDLLPKAKEKSEDDESNKPHKNKVQFTIAGIILIYFGLSTLYAIWM
jgi:hypothetical protein